MDADCADGKTLYSIQISSAAMRNINSGNWEDAKGADGKTETSGAARDGAICVVRETSAGRGRRAALEGDRAALLNIGAISSERVSLRAPAVFTFPFSEKVCVRTACA